ncbi:MAG TPA: hypothetical protein VEP49_10920 [Acidimicrobiia bacterium]|nr:hypothetical protein [Acidimicrobiia bacterium]
MRRLAVLLVALVAVLAGCKVDTAVTVDMHEDGSGVVTVRATLDAEAVQDAEVGGAKLEDRVRLGDLTAAGWKVSPWVRSGAGSAQIELSKPFETPAQVAPIINEISGPNGPLRDFSASRDRGAASTKYAVRGALDLAAIGTGVTGDQDLVNALTNQQVDVGAIDQSLLAELRDSVTVSVVVKLPDGSTTTVDGVPGKRLPVDASASVLDTRRVVLLGIAVVLVVLAVVVLLIGRRRRRARAPIPRFEVHSREGETMR